jgi:hypothetical protein
MRFNWLLRYPIVGLCWMLLGFSLSLTAQTAQDLVAFKQNGLWGLLNEKGQVVHEAKYEGLSKSPNGSFIAWIPSVHPDSADIMGLIGKDGQVLLPFEYRGCSQLLHTPRMMYYLPHPEDTVLLLKRGQYWGMFSTSGKELLPCEYDWFYEIGSFFFSWSDFGANPTQTNRLIYQKGSKQGFVDRKGKLITTPEFDLLHYSTFHHHCKRFPVDMDKIPFRCSIAKKGEFGFVDTMGKTVLPFEYDTIYIQTVLKTPTHSEYEYPEIGLYYVVQKSGRFSLLDYSLQPLTEQIWDAATSVHHTGAIEGYINGSLTVQKIRKENFHRIFLFQENGLFPSWPYHNDENLLVNSCIIQMDSLPYKLQEAYGHGLVAIYNGEKAKYGFYNSQRKVEVSDCIYDAVRIEDKRRPFYYYYEEEAKSAALLNDIGVVVRQGDKYGLLLSDGKGIPCQYDDIGLIYPNVALVRQGKHWYLADLTGRLLNPSLQIDEVAR